LRGVSCGRTWMKARSPENIVWVDEGKGGGEGLCGVAFLLCCVLECALRGVNGSPGCVLEYLLMV
jgi:hypothetical protein